VARPPTASGAEVADVAKILEKAFADGAAASRAANDALNASLRNQGAALEAAYKRISELEDANTQLIGILDRLGTAATRQALIDSNEKIEAARLKAEQDWKNELLKELGPGAKELIAVLKSKLSPSLLKGDGTKEGEGRAALMRVVMKIMGDTALQDQIVALAGSEDWVKAIEFLQQQAGGGAPAQPTTSNGAPN